VRFCKFWFARHHDRGIDNDGTGASRRRGCARHEIHCFWHAHDVPDWRDCWCAKLKTEFYSTDKCRHRAQQQSKANILIPGNAELWWQNVTFVDGFMQLSLVRHIASQAVN